MAQKITTFLWFDTQCEEAMNYYVKVFNEAPYSRKNSRINWITRHETGVDMTSDVPGAAELEGKVLTGDFELEGQHFQALDGGPMFKFNEAVSLVVECKDQAEVDYFWDRLSAVKEAESCGWCKDKFGLSWQVTPRRLMELLADKDRTKVQRVSEVVLQQQKIVIKDLEEAYKG